MFARLDGKKSEFPEYLTEWGEHNGLPNPYVPCDKSEFLYMFSIYSPRHMEYSRLH